MQDPELEVEPISSLKGSSKDTPSVPKGPNISVNQRPTSNTASSGMLECWSLSRL